MKLLIIFFLGFASLLGACGNEHRHSEEQIARKYCGSCHLFPEPSLLDKHTWKDDVLPQMAARLGIQLYDGKYAATLPKNVTGNDADTTFISFNNWMALVDYYTRMAPEKLPPQNRRPINEFTNRFVVRQPAKEDEPSITYIKIDPGNQLIYTGSAYDSSFSVYNKSLQLIKKRKIGKITVHLDFSQPLSLPAQRRGLLTSIGSFFPSNQKAGTIDSFYISGNGGIKLTSNIADSLPRPVQAIHFESTNDSENLVVCGFGNETGELYFLSRSSVVDAYKEKILSQFPGAVNACIDDYNKDGLPDIIVLFAQAMEGIYLFTNKGNGNFETKELLRFPPVYGSTYFDMQDLNGDGLKDIIYTCGDNYDYSRILKNYHGIYIFINGGANGFRQEYFFPIHGCYKVVGRDFDKDGDIDMAAISFFPDVKNQQQESFVYLENKGDLRFCASSIPEVKLGNWITMDAADLDGDGDDDIVIGSLLLRNPQPASTKTRNTVPFLLLTNRTR